VKLYWLTKVNGVTKRFPCHVNKVGHITNGDVMTAHPRGYFQTLSYVDGANKWNTVPGTRCTETSTEHERTAAKIRAEDALRKRGQIATVKAKHAQQETAKHEADPIYLLRDAAEWYIEWLGKDGRAEAKVHAQLVLYGRESKFGADGFLAVCRRMGIERTHQIGAEHVSAYIAECQQQGNSERTRANKYDRLMFFFNQVNIKTREQQLKNKQTPSDRVSVRVIQKLTSRPKEDKKGAVVKTYSKVDIDALFAAADDYMTTVLHLGLGLGLREQEIMHAEWVDLDWRHHSFHVCSKPAYGFRVKDKEERHVAIPDTAFNWLKEWRAKNPNARLIAGTAGDNPNTHLLRTLKRMAKNADLNCGECAGCKGRGQECRKFGLHTMRRTYCTGLIRGGADIKTVQQWMGHADIETTLIYQKHVDARSKQGTKTANSIDFGD
jgi:integrase